MPEIKFEESLNKLEKIVAGLETGTISLEDSLKKYEEGIKLARFCSHKLEEAEQKIEILTQDKDGKLTREPFKICIALLATPISTVAAKLAISSNLAPNRSLSFRQSSVTVTALPLSLTS